MLAANGGQYPTIGLTASGVAVLKGQQKVQRKMAAKAKATLAVDDDLFQQLRNLRRELAEASGVPPYVIFSDQTLKQLAAEKPQDRLGMLKIKGIGEHKLDKYGKQFLAVLQEA